MKTITKPESFAMIAKEDQVRLYFGDTFEIKGPQQLNQLQTLQNEHPDRQIVFANPFDNIYERFPIEREPQKETSLLTLVTKNQRVKQLTRKNVSQALGANLAPNELAEVTPIESLEYLHDACSIIQMTRAQAQKLLPELVLDNLAMDPAQNPGTSDFDFAQRVKAVQDEIREGNISQAVISRFFQGKFKRYDSAVVQGIFHNLLNQYGAYMSFLFVDNKTKQSLVGASPERHVSVSPKTHHNEVRRNALAGTLPKAGMTPENYEEQVEAFLEDPKEINELLQVTDEDAKSVFPLCAHGRIEGPHLYEMPAVFHTGYEIIGLDPTKRPPLDYLKETQHAATLVGGPIESALRVLEKTAEPKRRYYGGEFGLLKPNGELDTSIIIRTAEIMPNGEFFIQSGAGVVSDSIPEKEVLETIAKARGMIKALTEKTLPAAPFTGKNKRAFREKLRQRNQNLNRFLLQEKVAPEQTFQGRRILIINNEDNFAHTQAMMIQNMGAEVTVLDREDFTPEETRCFDMVLLGPGPGDLNTHTPEMEQTKAIATFLRQEKIPTLGVCLGHQALSQSLGMNITKEQTPKQGKPSFEEINGNHELIGFYNSFSPERDPKKTVPADISVDTNGRSLMMEGDSFVSVQFHPESIMTPNGYEILKKLIQKTLGKKQ